MSKLQTQLLGVNMKNPIITASGCFGYGSEYQDYFDVDLLGAVALKGLTLEPRAGNSGIRIVETASGMLNSIGLENPGIHYFKEHIAPNIGFSTPIILNINGNTIEEYVEIAQIANSIDRVDFIELNISCPNVKKGGIHFGSDIQMAADVVSSVKKVLQKPLMVKLSPNVTDIVSIAKTAQDYGADALSLVNTFLGMAIDVKTKAPLLSNIFGGLSGPCIKPIALRMVYQIYKQVHIPIIAMGGIANTTDALEFFMAGASIVSIGSALFGQPTLPVEMINGLNNYLDKQGILHIKDVIGCAH